MTAARDHNDRSRRAGYEGSRPELQELVPAGAANVLELGCSVGALGVAIKERRPTRILGVEISEELAARARGRLDRVVVGDAEEFLAGPPPPEAPFDCLVCADVLEHLVDPWQALRRAVALLRPGGVAVVSLPNVFYWATLLPALVARRWPREPEGIFDASHLRWFGRGDASDLLSGAGLVDVEVRPSYWSAPSRKWLVRLLGRTFLRDYLAAQFLATGAVPQPGAGSSAVT